MRKIVSRYVGVLYGRVFLLGLFRPTFHLIEFKDILNTSGVAKPELYMRFITKAYLNNSYPFNKVHLLFK